MNSLTPDPRDVISKNLWMNHWICLQKYIQFDVLHSFVAKQLTQIYLVFHMWPFGDIKYIPNSCGWKSILFIAGSSDLNLLSAPVPNWYCTCFYLASVLSYRVWCPAAHTHRQTHSEDRANSQSLRWELRNKATQALLEFEPELSNYV